MGIGAPTPGFCPNQSSGLGGGETSGSSPTVPMANVASSNDQYLAADDSDTSDDESEAEDHHPDPYPQDPDMTGWTDNQIGCFYYGRYKHFKKKWRNFQGARKPAGRRMARPRAKTGRFVRRRSYAVAGRRKRGNPIGRDGNPLTCHTCGSTEHFQANCPQRQQQQRSSSSHNAARYEFSAIPTRQSSGSSNTRPELEPLLQQRMRSNGNESLGMLTFWDSRTTIEEVPDETNAAVSTGWGFFAASGSME